MDHHHRPDDEDDIEEDNHELSVTPVPESINDDDEEIPSIQVDENVPQQQQQQHSSSSVIITTTTTAAPDDNESASTTSKTDEIVSASHTLRENQQIAGRISPLSGPGLAKPLSMTSSTSSSSKEQHRPSPPPSAGKKRVDAALEKNIETIVTQVRRTTTKPSQLTQNDLELFDGTATTPVRNGHHSREITPTSSSSNSKQAQHQSSSSREMTPDSINTDSAPEDQQPVRNGHRHHQQQQQQQRPPPPPPLPHVDLSQYGQPPWPPVYPFQHPGLYLPFPPPTTTTPTNGVPSFYSPAYPSYDPLLIEQHYGSQALSAYYAQQQAANARVLQEHIPLSDNLSSTLTTPTKEYSGSGDSIKSADSITDIRRKKKTPLVNSTYQASTQLNGSLSKLSPDLSSDGGTNDADSIVSLESQKSSVAAVGMPVLEDGLSDSECISGDELSPPITKNNGRHQSTQSDFLFDANHPSLTSHKRQFAKSTPNRNQNDLELPQSQSFYIRPPPPSSLVQPTTTNRSATPPSNWNPHPPAEERSRNGSTSTMASAVATEYDTDEETDKLLGVEHRTNVRNQAIRDAAVTKPSQTTNNSKPREVIKKTIVDPENSSVLIEGVLFRCRYLGSTQLLVEGNPTKASRMMQAQEAVSRIKAPQGESQPSVEVDLFISTEKIMVLNTDLQDILMDHSLRSISYIADIGDLVVLMAKRRYLQHSSTDDHNGSDDSNETSTRRVVSINQKMICHVFESEEAQSVAHSIGQAFQVAYVEFLKANGIDDPSFARDIDYQEVLNQQEIGSEELDRFSKKECQKEVILPKGKNEPLGIVIVESGWGSMLPTVVIANMMPGGPAARCGHLNIGDQIISVNGISLVGLPLSSCQTQIKSVKHLTTVRLVVVPCPPVVEVLIRRPDTKYQLGFSVQNGIICSLLRGGIAERGGVRVGHRIIEINGQSVVATQHERIVSMLSNSIGELRMKTMPTQMYRLLTGQENPTYI